MYNFDKSINRSDTNSEKWNKKLILEYFGRDDIIPMWVADMDFEVSDQIQTALKAHSKNSIFGYEKKDQELIDSIISWHKNKFDWNIKKESIRFTPSILNAIANIINTFTKEGDGVIIQPPVFFHFKQLIIKNNREVVTNPLKLNDGKYQIDFEDLEQKASNPNNKVLILCNPHNPIGRVWEKEELEKIAQISKKYNLLVISDEIHNGIVFKEYNYTPFSTLYEYSFALISPAKTFNIPSVSDSIVITNNKELREKFDLFTKRMFLHKTNTFNIVAMKEAYQDTSSWLDEALCYIEDNLKFLKKYIKKNIPKVKVIEPQGTFLIWLDFRELGLDVIELKSFLTNEANLALNAGHWFGREGAGFSRMTIACSRSLLKQVLKNLESAINARDTNKK